jgi:hypothetical protein
MQWFFALNEGASDWFGDMIKVAVRSARQNTSLEPVCLYDGKANQLTDWLAAEGVNVVSTHVPFRGELFSQRIRSINAGTHYTPEHACGAFLRTQAANYATDDVFLYTDCDVMFLDDAISATHTDRIAAVPENDKTHSFNSGAMLINRRYFTSHLPGLIRYIGARGFYHRDAGSYDQCFLNEYFAQQWEPLPSKFNWRPGDGANPEASIVHFHGPKPTRISAIMAGNGSAEEADLQDILDRNPEGYRHYVRQFEAYLAAG